MKNLHKHRYLISIFSFACMLTLHGCGGSSEEEKISVYAGYFEGSEDDITPNSPQAAQSKLTAAGVNSSNLMCTDLSPASPPPGADTVQIQSPIVIVDINANDLGKAKAVGYGLTSDVQTRMTSGSALKCEP